MVQVQMRVAVSGSSGFIGSALAARLVTSGHHVVRLVRSAGAMGPDAARWDPAGGVADASRLEGLDAVVHLAGENIASGRWTADKKRRIRDSRVEGTRRLCEAVARLRVPPKALVGASAIGYYGDRGEDVLTEDSAAGEGFLAKVCREWEAAAAPAVVVEAAEPEILKR